MRPVLSDTGKIAKRVGVLLPSFHTPPLGLCHNQPHATHPAAPRGTCPRLPCTSLERTAQARAVASCPGRPRSSTHPPPPPPCTQHSRHAPSMSTICIGPLCIPVQALIPFFFILFRIGLTWVKTHLLGIKAPDEEARTSNPPTHPPTYPHHSTHSPTHRSRRLAHPCPRLQADLDRSFHPPHYRCRPPRASESTGQGCGCACRAGFYRHVVWALPDDCPRV